MVGSAHRPEFIPGSTWHGRRGAVAHAFRYRVDFVLLDPESTTEAPLFGRNRWSVASVNDTDHGGAKGAGAGAAWARRALDHAGIGQTYRLLLLTQPRWFGMVFNPVSFWLAFRRDALVAVIAEVSNTYGDRHSYLCARADFAPIGPRDPLTATKVFHVSPFQDVSGRYVFNFDIRPEAIDIRIAHLNADEGLIATLSGPRRPMTAGAVLRGAVRFPFAGLRPITLIHWQALRLWIKGARFRARPAPPAEDIT